MVAKRRIKIPGRALAPLPAQSIEPADEFLSTDEMFNDGLHLDPAYLAQIQSGPRGRDRRVVPPTTGVSITALQDTRIMSTAMGQEQRAVLGSMTYTLDATFAGSAGASDFPMEFQLPPDLYEFLMNIHSDDDRLTMASRWANWLRQLENPACSLIGVEHLRIERMVNNSVAEGRGATLWDVSAQVQGHTENYHRTFDIEAITHIGNRSGSNDLINNIVRNITARS